MGVPGFEASADRRLARLAAARHGVFSRREALAAGASRRLIETRLNAARWEALYPGVYRMAGTPESWRQRLLAACVVAGDEARASHRSAAAVHQLPGGVEALLEMSIASNRRVHRSGILIHVVGGLEPVDAAIVDAIPVTTVTRTLIDLAAVVDVDVLEEALDDALRRKLTRLSRLQWRLEKLGTRGRRGAGDLRGLIEDRVGRGAVVESVIETRFLRLLRRAGLPEPECQYEIRDRGRVIARVDFAYPDARVAIEVDGYRWHSGRVRWEHDLGRRNRLTAIGWHVIHVTSNDLEHRRDEVFELIAQALKEARLQREVPSDSGRAGRRR